MNWSEVRETEGGAMRRALKDGEGLGKDRGNMPGRGNMKARWCQRVST